LPDGCSTPYLPGGEILRADEGDGGGLQP